MRERRGGGISGKEERLTYRVHIDLKKASSLTPCKRKPSIYVEKGRGAGPLSTEFRGLSLAQGQATNGFLDHQRKVSREVLQRCMEETRGVPLTYIKAIRTTIIEQKLE